MTFMETSAKDGFHTEEAFDTLIKSIVHKLSSRHVKKEEEVRSINGKGIAISASAEAEPPKQDCC